MNFKKMSTDQLLVKYRSSLKAGFDNVFGRTAREETNRIVDILHERGVFHYTTIFGERLITKWK